VCVFVLSINQSITSGAALAIRRRRRRLGARAERGEAPHIFTRRDRGRLAPSLARGSIIYLLDLNVGIHTVRAAVSWDTLLSKASGALQGTTFNLVARIRNRWGQKSMAQAIYHCNENNRKHDAVF